MGGQIGARLSGTLYRKGVRPSLVDQSWQRGGPAAVLWVIWGHPSCHEHLVASQGAEMGPWQKAKETAGNIFSHKVFVNY